MDRRNTLKWDVLKRILLLFIPSLGALGVIVYSICSFERLNFREELFARERMVLQMATKIVREHLEGAMADLWFLAEVPEIPHSLINRGETSSPLLAELLRLSVKTGKYDELCLWDEKGEKSVRFSNGGGVFREDRRGIAAPGGKDPLWSKIASLDSHEIFITSTSGKEGPESPAGVFTICLGTPVRDKNNDLKGVLIFYYGGRDILEHFLTWGIDRRKIMLVSPRGFGLNDPEGRDGEEGSKIENGFQIPGGKENGPWARISGEEEGQIFEKGGFFTFSTIYPGRPDRRSFPERESHSGIAAPFPKGETCWKLISRIDSRILGEKEAEILRTIFPVSAIMVVLLLAGSVILAVSGAARKADRQEKEKALDETIILSNIGKIISSTFEIEDVYERFAGEVKKLVPFDRILITVDNPEEGTIQIAYAAGIHIPGFEPGKKLPSGDPFNERVVKDRAPILFLPESREEVETQYPSFAALFEAGLRSLLSAPLISGNRVIGILHLRSLTPKAYGERDRRLIEGIADQIAGAIANSHLFKERNRVQEALQESEEKFRHMSAAAQDAIITMAENGHISFWNQAAERMFGFRPDEALNQDLHSLIVPPHFRKRFAEAFPLFRKTGRGKAVGRVIEMEGVRKGGEVFPLELSLSAVEIRDRWHAIGIIRDITERKRAESQVLQAKESAEKSSLRLAEALDQANRLTLEAAAANEAKSAFLANMSHEIRTPLNGVVGMAEFLLDTPLTPEQRDYAHTLRRSAGSLLQLINDILDFSKIEAGRLELESVDFDLRLILEETLEPLALKGQKKGLEIASLVYRDVPTLLRGDPHRLRQILTNLCGNAIKFTEKGEVVIRVSLEEEDVSRAKIRFAVADTGIGIPRDRRDCLFRSFSQVDSSITRKYGGTGLGLAISRTLAELLGGEIGVESEEGKGSTFWFTAVLGKQAGKEKETVRLSDALEGGRILVAVGNDAHRAIVAENLRVWGCEFDEAANGREALAKLCGGAKGGKSFRLAILESLLPDMDAETLAKKVKGEPGLASLPLVLLTPQGECKDPGQFQGAGFSACLKKPIKSSQFYDCLGKLLGKKPSAPGAPRAVAAPQTPEGRKAENKKILLAEDNLTNQKVALGMLRKIGYSADVVENGKEVLNALARATYDLILMDVQMPVMDGFAATRAIRKAEERSGGHIPIVAMTAHAMKGDRELCLERGMDDYLSKPISAEELREVMHRQLGKAVNQGTERLTPGFPRGESIFQKEILWERLGGDPNLFRDIIRTFLEDAPRQIFNLRNTLEEGDFEGVESGAHTLKGAAMNIGGAALQSVAYQIEICGKNRDLEKARYHFPDLEEEFTRLASALRHAQGPGKTEDQDGGSYADGGYRRLGEGS